MLDTQQLFVNDECVLQKQVVCGFSSASSSSQS